MFVMQKIKELFASTLNGVTASVRCVSSMMVVLYTKIFAITCGARKQKIR